MMPSAVSGTVVAWHSADRKAASIQHDKIVCPKDHRNPQGVVDAFSGTEKTDLADPLAKIR